MNLYHELSLHRLTERLSWGQSVLIGLQGWFLNHKCSLLFSLLMQQKCFSSHGVEGRVAGKLPTLTSSAPIRGVHSHNKNLFFQNIVSCFSHSGLWQSLGWENNLRTLRLVHQSTNNERRESCCRVCWTTVVAVFKYS